MRPTTSVVAHHAGGMEALLRAVENVEDSEEGGAADAAAVTGLDVVIGLAASGSTPYVAGALRAARAAGATTALVTSNPAAPLAGLADILIAADTGPEVIAGSTRLKAGTAQKLILNSFSTTLMIKLGRTWSNLMVDMVATNNKLRGRMLRILAEATGADDEACSAALEAAAGELKPALVHLLTGAPVPAARAALEDADGRVAVALAKLGASDPVRAPTVRPCRHLNASTRTTPPPSTSGTTPAGKPGTAAGPFRPACRERRCASARPVRASTTRPGCGSSATTARWPVPCGPRCP
jgi:N-acetylmuramic acid 6-phosphate etherase